jgi:hypothetical protein
MNTKRKRRKKKKEQKQNPVNSQQEIEPKGNIKPSSDNLEDKNKKSLADIFASKPVELSDEEFNRFVNRVIDGAIFSVQLKVAMDRIRKLFPAPAKSKEIEEVQKTIDNTPLDRIRKPDFALRFYLESLEK